MTAADAPGIRHDNKCVSTARRGGIMAYFAARQAQTTLDCPECDHKLEIARTCHEAFMRCPACGRRFPLEQFISQADEAMERFLEGLYCDRI